MPGFEHRTSDSEIYRYELLNLWNILGCCINMTVGYIYFIASRTVHILVRRLVKLRKALISFIMSVCPFAWNNWAHTGRNFTKFYIWLFSENLTRKFKFHENLTRITGTLHEDQYTFLIVSHSVLLRMRNVSDKICRENQNTHFVFNNFLFWNHAFYEKMW
jgi:hypothetical protein